MKSGDRMYPPAKRVGQIKKLVKAIISTYFFASFFFTIFLYWNASRICRGDPQQKIYIASFVLLMASSIISLFWFSFIFPNLIKAIASLRVQNPDLYKNYLLFILVVAFALGSLTKIHWKELEKSFCSPNDRSTRFAERAAPY